MPAQISTSNEIKTAKKAKSGKSNVKYNIQIEPKTEDLIKNKTSKLERAIKADHDIRKEIFIKEGSTRISKGKNYLCRF